MIAPPFSYGAIPVRVKAMLSIGLSLAVGAAAFVDAELTLEHWRSGRGNDYLSRLEFGALVECRKAGYHLLVELVDIAEAVRRGVLKP